MVERNSLDSGPREYGRDKALEGARSILQGKLGIIEGARLLSNLAHDLVPDWAVDPDFVVFRSLDSETDHLPVGAERQLWEANRISRARRYRFAN